MQSALVSEALTVSPIGGYTILYLIPPTKHAKKIELKTFFFVGWGGWGVVLRIILYPAGYANSMQILETLKLHTVQTILIPESTAVIPE